MQIHAADSLDLDYADPYAFINMCLANPQETTPVPTDTGAFLPGSATLPFPPVSTSPAPASAVRPNLATLAASRAKRPASASSHDSRVKRPRGKKSTEQLKKTIEDLRRKNADLTTKVTAQAADIQHLQALLERSSYPPIAAVDHQCCRESRRRIFLLEKSIQDMSNYIQELRTIQRDTAPATSGQEASGQVLIMEQLALSWKLEASKFCQKTISAARQLKDSFLAQIPEDHRHGNLALRIHLAYAHRILTELAQKTYYCGDKRILLAEVKGIIDNELKPHHIALRVNCTYGQVQFNTAKPKYDAMLKLLAKVDSDRVVLRD
jgi:hypothetical protein